MASSGRKVACIAIAVFAALSLWAGIASDGFLEADGVTHYLYARFALRGSPHFLVNVWGRPVFTTLYALPAGYFGLAGARVMSLVLATACALVAMRIARNQQYRWPALALVFTLGQPLVFLHSFSELTELPFALLLGLTFLAYQTRRFLAMAICAALLPLARPEGFGLLLLAAIALVLHRRAWLLLILPLALVAWNHAGWMLFGRDGPWWKWLISCWPYSHQSLYEAGYLLHFVALLPAVVSPLVFPATCLGIWRSFASDDSDAHRRRCQWLIALIPLMILVGHSGLYWLGKLASSGEVRYMLIVAPFWALLSARGWEWVWERFGWQRPLLWGGAAVLAAGLANVAYPVLPLRPTDDFERAREFVRWYEASGASNAYPRISTGQMPIYLLLDVSPTDAVRAMEFRRDLVQSPPAGTMIVWDPVYSMYNADENRSIGVEELMSYGWIELPDAPDVGGGGDFLRSLNRCGEAMRETPHFRRCL